MTNKEKFLALVSKEETKTVERAKARIARKSYTKLSNEIAYEILERLDILKWKQKDLAEKMNVSPQQVSKWVKGNENFTIETLVNLGKILGTDLIHVGKEEKVIQKVEIKISTREVYEHINFIKPVQTNITRMDTFTSSYNSPLVIH